MELTKNEIIQQLINSGGWSENEAKEDAEIIFTEGRYCHQCGNTDLIYEGPAEGYSCPKCGSSDSDE